MRYSFILSTSKDVQDSEPYRKMEYTKVCTSIFLDTLEAILFRQIL